ncbi:MAG TPA: hypothetical protein DEG43_04770 [Acidimicrobiaceae bacterium]|nr:hypothetical protein [Acidimicrobiaceae bacterium]
MEVASNSPMVKIANAARPWRPLRPLLSAFLSSAVGISRNLSATGWRVLGSQPDIITLDAP